MLQVVINLGMVSTGPQPAERGSPEFRCVLQVWGFNADLARDALGNADVLGHEGVREA